MIMNHEYFSDEHQLSFLRKQESSVFDFKRRWFPAFAGMTLCLIVSGCLPTSKSVDVPQIYKTPAEEAQWIRKGEPLIYQDHKWYPSDATENFMDTEVIKLGEYQDAAFFASKEDVEPYDRLYTKFSRNRYRYYKLKSESDDQDHLRQ
ncbi:MAG: hypothetical protein COW13_03740 [Candidatus Omnitrophica bacterium CG12_big_fil_rev_8_21_14_0_65_50_5]|nr:MAG: hypothetical protein COW13_03740 [Candidatus Omnitrophica bacterium CG12_big_fil_rev_8_21_14_0_65_50_5]